MGSLEILVFASTEHFMDSFFKWVVAFTAWRHPGQPRATLSSYLDKLLVQEFTPVFDLTELMPLLSLLLHIKLYLDSVFPKPELKLNDLSQVEMTVGSSYFCLRASHDPL